MHAHPLNTELIFNYFPNLTPLQKQQIEMLYPLYSEWNSRINVISRKDIDKLYLHHVLHSLAIARFCEFSDHIQFGEGVRILDVGTGGGFPGIPLAILFPRAEFLLVDSIGKKIKVVNEVITALGLPHVKAVQTRVEQVEGPFDYIVSRAVADLSDFLPWVKGKYTRGVIYLKGGDLSEGGALTTELNQALGQASINRRSITICDIEKWFADEFFADKKVIFIPR